MKAKKIEKWKVGKRVFKTKTEATLFIKSEAEKALSNLFSKYDLKPKDFKDILEKMEPKPIAKYIHHKTIATAKREKRPEPAPKFPLYEKSILKKVLVENDCETVFLKNVKFYQESESPIEFIEEQLGANRSSVVINNPHQSFLWISPLVLKSSDFWENIYDKIKIYENRA